jgi:transcriptional regulator with XRE-family HTH domain
MTKVIEMDLRDYIEEGQRRHKSLKELAVYLGVTPNSLTDAKAHRRSLSASACVKLSDLLNVDLREIIAASELATERKEEKRAFWLPFVKSAQIGKIAGLTLILAVVTNFVTPSPAEAAPMLEVTRHVVCIMLSMIYFSCLQDICKNNSLFLQIGLISQRSRFRMAPGMHTAP